MKSEVNTAPSSEAISSDTSIYTSSEGIESNNATTHFDISVSTQSSTSAEGTSGSSEPQSTESILLNGEPVELSRTGRYKEEIETDNYESEIKLDIDIDTDSDTNFKITTN